MVSICFYFQVHQPCRLGKYTVFDIGSNHDYFDKKKNRDIMEKVAKKCYLPTNRLILDMINETDGKFRASYSLTGQVLEQMEEYVPSLIESFKELAATKSVEFLSETYNHSLSFLYSKKEFKEQLRTHKKKMWELFRQRPKVFRNTELIFNNELGKYIEDLGYEGILAEGADHILGSRSPNYIYTPTTCSKIKLLLKNYKMSDDVAFRFSNQGWKEYPLTAPKFSNWVNKVNGNGDCVNLFMDYETFGEHQWAHTGIFRFLKQLPHEILKHPDNNFMTPSELIAKYPSRGHLDMHNFVSWADLERDLSAWLGNKMQQTALSEIYAIEKGVRATKDAKLLDDWRKLQTSDHFYYMCTKWFADGDVHKYFNPYDSPYDAFITFMNVLNDIIVRIKTKNRNIYKVAEHKNTIGDEIIALTDRPSNVICD